MKKIIIILLLVLFSSQVTLARVTDNPIDYGRTPESLGGNLQSALDNTYYLNKSQPKPIGVLTVDVRDLQAQINELDRKNAQLELKISNLQVQPVVVPQPQVISQTDTTQTQRISTLENKVGILETTMNAVSKSIQKTLDLLTKLLNLLK